MPNTHRKCHAFIAAAHGFMAIVAALEPALPIAAGEMLICAAYAYTTALNGRLSKAHISY